MGNGRGFKTDKEYDYIDKLKHENKKLKRELKAARKLLDRYQVAEQCGLFDGEKILPSKKRQKEKNMYEQWKCHDCGKGTLKLIFIGPFYFRRCDICNKTTKRKKIHNELLGIKQDGSIYEGDK